MKTSILYATAFVLFFTSTLSCKKSDTTPKATTDYAAMVAGTKVWTGGLYTEQESITQVTDTTFLNDTTFTIIRVNDTAIAVWGDSLSRLSSGYFVSVSAGLTVNIIDSVIHFEKRFSGNGVVRKQTYHTKL